MIDEAYNYLRDVSGYLRLAVQQRVRTISGIGVDYGDDLFKRRARTLAEGLHPRRMRLEVVEVVDETPSTKTYRLRRLDGPLPPFRPGQYVNLYVRVDQVHTSRPYSLSSAPGAELLELTVRDNPEGFVAPWLLEHLGVGDVIETSGPEGGFFYEPLIHGRELVFLAGGSGITPFMSMLRAWAAGAQDPPEVHLIYGNRSPEDVIFGVELSDLDRKSPWLTMDLVISEPPEGYPGLTGLLDAELIGDRIGAVADKRYFVCGPGAMYDLCAAALSELGVPRYRIKRELYGPPPQVTQQPGWPEGVSAHDRFKVEIGGREPFEARADEPLLCALERQGLVVPALCRAGECSYCRLKLIRGEVFMPADVGLREADRTNGYIHSCVAYPLSNLTLRL